MNCKRQTSRTILTFTDHNNLNLPFANESIFGYIHAPQCPRASIWTCAVCLSDCYFLFISIIFFFVFCLTSKYFKWLPAECAKKWMAGRSVEPDLLWVLTAAPQPLPRCVALIKIPVIFVQMEMKININMSQTNDITYK